MYSCTAAVQQAGMGPQQGQGAERHVSIPRQCMMESRPQDCQTEECGAGTAARSRWAWNWLLGRGRREKDKEVSISRRCIDACPSRGTIPCQLIETHLKFWPMKHEMEMSQATQDGRMRVRVGQSQYRGAQCGKLRVMTAQSNDTIVHTCKCYSLISTLFSSASATLFSSTCATLFSILSSQVKALVSSQVQVLYSSL